jgi:hypothetical protein
VTDLRLGESFDVAVGVNDPLEVFHHPYAYAASPVRDVDRRLAGSARA